MGINTDTIKFREEITNIINNSNIPPINILLVLDIIQKEVSNIVMQQLQQERKTTEEGDK